MSMVSVRSAYGEPSGDFSPAETTRVIVKWAANGYAFMDLPMAVNQNDQAQTAMVASTVTATRLESHEKVCAERYGDIKTSFDRVHSRLDKIMYGLIGLLITMVGWLLINGVPWK